MGTHFRIASVGFDGDEEVASVTAVVSLEASRIIAGLLGKDILETSFVQCPSHPGCRDHVSVTIPADGAVQLFGACGKISGPDPRHEVTTEAWNSLSMVVYGIMGE
jgi:hypothetical protein